MNLGIRFPRILRVTRNPDPCFLPSPLLTLSARFREPDINPIPCFLFLSLHYHHSPYRSNLSTTMSNATGRLQNKICLITGGMRGFGASIVSLFVSQGAKCLVLDLLVPDDKVGYYDPFTIEPLPSSPSTTSLAEKSAYAVKSDITSRQSWIEALQTSKKVFGAVPTVVVNNAGWTYSNKPTLEVEEEEFDRVFSVNVKSIYLSVDVLLPAMLQEVKEGKGGKDRVFVNVSSTAAIRPRPGLVWCKFKPPFHHHIIVMIEYADIPHSRTL